MKKCLKRAAQGMLLCCLAIALPVLAQDSHPQQNDHPERQKQTQTTEHRAQNPAQSHGARPQANQRPAEHQAQRQNQPQPDRGNTHAQPQPDRRVQQQPDRGARPAPNRSQQYGANQRRGNHSRPAQWGRPPSRRGSYSFRSNDRSRLHSYYMARLGAINRYNRPIFRVGGYFPYADIGYLSPLPPDLYGTLPPPPYGYQMGYYDGYVVVYDPMTYFIASVIDLLQ